MGHSRPCFSLGLSQRDVKTENHASPEMWSLLQPLSLPVIFQPKAWEAGGAITIFFRLQIDSLGIDILQLAHIPRWYPVFFFSGRWNFQGTTSLREGFKKYLPVKIARAV